MQKKKSKGPARIDDDGSALAAETKSPLADAAGRFEDAPDFTWRPRVAARTILPDSMDWDSGRRGASAE